MEPTKLKETLDKHRLWLEWQNEGERANLSRADLRGANLSGADLRGADLQKARYSVLSVLQAWWHGVDIPDDLCLAMMRFDASYHPRPKAFDEWAAGGPCPYDGQSTHRALEFAERRNLWKPGRPPRPWVLWQRLAEAAEIKI